MADVVIQILRDPIPAPSAIAPDLNADIDEFFKRALERDREKRFQSARDLAAAFVALGGDRLSVDWQEAAPSLSLRSGQPRGENDPTAKLTSPDRTTAIREAPPRFGAAPNPKITMSDLPTAPRALLTPHRGSPGQFADDPGATPHTVSVEGTLAPVGRSAAPWHVLRGSRGKSAAIAAVVSFILAAVIVGNALIGRGRAQSSEAASAGPPAANVTAASSPIAAPSVAAPSTSSLSPELVSAAPVPSAPEVGAQPGARSGVGSRIHEPTGDCSEHRSRGPYAL
jgi:serine/threonine-protein kinase